MAWDGRTCPYCNSSNLDTPYDHNHPNGYEQTHTCLDCGRTYRMVYTAGYAEEIDATEASRGPDARTIGPRVNVGDNVLGLGVLPEYAEAQARDVTGTTDVAAEPEAVTESSDSFGPDWAPMNWGERAPEAHAEYDAWLANDQSPEAQQMRARTTRWISEHPDEAAARGITVESVMGTGDPLQQPPQPQRSHAEQMGEGLTPDDLAQLSSGAVDPAYISPAAATTPLAPENEPAPAPELAAQTGTVAPASEELVNPEGGELAPSAEASDVSTSVDSPTPEGAAADSSPEPASPPAPRE